MSQWVVKARDAYAELKSLLQELLSHAQELGQKQEQVDSSQQRIAAREPSSDFKNTIRSSRRRNAAHPGERQIPPTRRARSELSELSKSELYQQAQALGISGRSRMRKDELRRAIQEQR